MQLDGHSYPMFMDGDYRRLPYSHSTPMDIDPSAYGGSVYSSEGSNHLTAASTDMLIPDHIKGTTAERSVVQNSSPSISTGDDALSNALMDARYPTAGLQGYEEWTLDLRRLHMGPAFAQGAFGRLYRGTYNGEEVAIKLLDKPENNLERAQFLENQFAKEVLMLASLRHENVVRFIGACWKPLVWCIATEYAKGGSLRMFLVRRRVIPLRLAVKYALDVARGMEYLHSFGVIHRDLKSDNLLIADKSIKIADFGVARIEVQTEGMTPETGTYRWMAPEMIQRRSYNNKVDVYSFGIVLWELITGNLPFQDMTAVQAAFAVVNKGKRPEIPTDCSPALAQIMTRCWDANPELRPPFSEVVQLLEEAQQLIMRTVGTAVFRRCGCLATPLTLE
ncbi:hypothetical protein GOP47_0009186 [Adiantum capillus-veneris]|uniref:non-specific serine/threonine protein kinase n=1 Tax=Adiantum capillus-veneris TaxID=13818 RepID=A0A9D4UWI9_ADICA|nr:hypothetical protein GOP47_0009186 [Adiantum capillus-veneris]